LHMEKIKLFIKTRQQAIVLAIGYLLVASIGFALGQLATVQEKGPEIRLEQNVSAESNYTPTVSGLQSETNSAECKIKGTPSSRIYHVPGQSGYDKLNALTCFATESAAQAAGFRKALR